MLGTFYAKKVEDEAAGASKTSLRNEVEDEAASASKTSFRNEVEDEAAKTSLRTPKVQTAYIRCNNRAGTPPMIPPPGHFGAGSSDSGQTDSD